MNTGYGICLASALDQGHQTIKMLNLLRFVLPSEKSGRAGILTGCPSTAAFAIALGPPNPPSISVAEETLDFRGTRFSRVLRLLMPTFSLVYTPEPLASTPSLRKQCSPTTAAESSENIDISKYRNLRCFATVRVFGNALEPR